jgi:hypothetical protein
VGAAGPEPGGQMIGVELLDVDRWVDPARAEESQIVLRWSQP